MSLKKDYVLKDSAVVYSSDDEEDEYTILPLESETTFEVKRHKSFLENDNIDALQPRRRSRLERQSISNIALTDCCTRENTQVGSLSNSVKTSPQIQYQPEQLGFDLNSHPHLDEITSIFLDGDNTHPISINHKRVAPYCFAFDIDGVILKGPNLIPEAKKAISILNGNNKHNIIVPYIFVTNGGGTDEKLRAEKLTRMLECDVDEFQVIQGHTPMRSLTNKYKNVLIVGGLGDDCRQIGLKYGFKNVYTVVDIIHWNPCVTPYYKLTEEETNRALKDVDFSKIQIDCILVMADSRNWTVDQQIMLELLVSENGVMGTHVDIRHDADPAVIEEKLKQNQPDLYFAHSDFVWATDYNLSRYGMGALQVSLAALYKEHTNGLELPCKRFGKPQRTTFDFATEFLEEWRKEVVTTVASTTKRRAQSISNAGFNTRETSISGSSRANSYLHHKKNNSLMQSSNHNSFAAAIVDSDEEEDEDAYSFSNRFSTVSSKLEGSESDSPSALSFEKHSIRIPPPTTVYFVGDTPESDIRFANLHHESWFSILVETGVYEHGKTPKYQPKAIKKTVLDAVEWVVEEEYKKEVAEWQRLSADYV